jgi:hypothetical protein
LNDIGPRAKPGARRECLAAGIYLAVSRAIVVSDCNMLVSCDMPPMPVSAGAAISPVVSAGGASAAGFSPQAASTRIADIKSSFFIGDSLTGWVVRQFFTG